MKGGCDPNSAKSRQKGQQIGNGRSTKSAIAIVIPIQSSMQLLFPSPLGPSLQKRDGGAQGQREEESPQG